MTLPQRLQLLPSLSANEFDLVFDQMLLSPGTASWIVAAEWPSKENSGFTPFAPG